MDCDAATVLRAGVLFTDVEESNGWIEPLLGPAMAPGPHPLSLIPFPQRDL